MGYGSKQVHAMISIADTTRHKAASAAYQGCSVLTRDAQTPVSFTQSPTRAPAMVHNATPKVDRPAVPMIHTCARRCH